MSLGAMSLTNVIASQEDGTIAKSEIYIKVTKVRTFCQQARTNTPHPPPTRGRQRPVQS